MNESSLQVTMNKISISLAIFLLVATESVAQHHCGYINGFPACKNIYMCFCNNHEVMIRKLNNYIFGEYLGPKCCQKSLETQQWIKKNLRKKRVSCFYFPFKFVTGKNSLKSIRRREHMCMLFERGKEKVKKRFAPNVVFPERKKGGIFCFIHCCCFIIIFRFSFFSSSPE